MYYIEGKYPFYLFILAALIHECGHIIAIKGVGGSIKRVDIMPLCARIVTGGAMPHKADMLIFLSGPTANIIMFLLYLPFLFVSNSPFVWYFAFVNLFLALINLLPIPGNDGYRAIESFFHIRSGEETVARRMRIVSVTAKTVFFALSFAAVVLSGFNPGVTALTAAANIYKKE